MEEHMYKVGEEKPLLLRPATYEEGRSHHRPRKKHILTMAGRYFMLFCLLAALSAFAGLGKRKQAPNILFILTDDQDIHMDSLSYMPLLKKYISDEGTVFSRHFCQVSLCCPSRVNMWTGQVAHRTNVTDLSPPYGGYPKFIEGGYNDKYLPVWLQAAGYNTYYVGKLFNSLSTDNYDDPFPNGWTGTDFLLDPYTYEYYNATFQRNRDPPVSYGGGYYSTDVVASKAAGYLADGLAQVGQGKPFFLTVAPTAPHSTVTNGTQSPPEPALRHRDLFSDKVVPRTPNFNPEVPSGVSWIETLPRQNQTNVDWNDSWYRNRLRTLQAVDEMIEALVQQLDDAGQLENTYIFYSTDNGYSIGQHRRQPGKQCAFEDDINIPLMVRGPGVAKGATVDLATSHTDMVPTFLDIAGVGQGLQESYELDGSAIPLYPQTSPLADDGTDQDQLDSSPVVGGNREHAIAEMWGIILSEGIYGYVLYNNHTYKATRLIGDGYNLLYTVWCTGEHELYDLVRDPWEMNNLANSSVVDPDTTPFQITPSHGGRATTTSVRNVIDRLDALTLVLKTCKMESCRMPWRSLHPEDDVQTLADALAPRYDSFYATRPRVQWSLCADGYLMDLEFPFWDPSLAYQDGSGGPRRGIMEHEVWTGL